MIFFQDNLYFFPYLNRKNPNLNTFFLSFYFISHFSSYEIILPRQLDPSFNQSISLCHNTWTITPPSPGKPNNCINLGLVAIRDIKQLPHSNKAQVQYELCGNYDSFWELSGQLWVQKRNQALGLQFLVFLVKFYSILLSEIELSRNYFTKILI